MRRNTALGGLIMLLVLGLALLGGFTLHRVRADQAAAGARLDALHEALDQAQGAEIAFKVQVQEWKNVLLRGFDPELRARHLNAMRQEAAEVRTRFDALATQPTAAATDSETAALRTLLPSLRRAHAALDDAYARALEGADLATAAGIRTADAAVRGADRGLQADLDRLASMLATTYQRESAALRQRMEERAESLAQALRIGGAAGLGLVLLLLALLTRTPRVSA